MGTDVTLDEYVRRLITARSEAEIYEGTAAIGKRLLSADTCLVATAADEEIVVQARAPTEARSDRDTLPLSNGIFGETSFVGSSHVFDDITTVRGSAAERPTPTADSERFRSLLLAPIGGEGFLIAAARDRGAFTEYDQEWAEQLAAWTTTAVEATPSASQASEPQPDGESTDRTGQADRRELMASILSHDATGPLNVVRGSLELAEATGETEHYERARTALDGLEQLIDEVAFLARTGDYIGQLDAVELREACETAWAAIERTDATLEIADSRTIVADEHALGQLLINLFKNAVTHSEGPVTITVGVLETGFYVEDDGPGIPTEDRERVFDWEYSGDDRTGIGLGIVDEIVQAHGWESAIVDGPDGGTRVEITGVDAHDER